MLFPIAFFFDLLPLTQCYNISEQTVILVQKSMCSMSLRCAQSRPVDFLEEMAAALSGQLHCQLAIQALFQKYLRLLNSTLNFFNYSVSFQFFLNILYSIFLMFSTHPHAIILIRPPLSPLSTYPKPLVAGGRACPWEELSPPNTPCLNNILVSSENV